MTAKHATYPNSNVPCCWTALICFHVSFSSLPWGYDSDLCCGLLLSGMPINLSLLWVCLARAQQASHWRVVPSKWSGSVVFLFGCHGVIDVPEKKLDHSRSRVGKLHSFFFFLINLAKMLFLVEWHFFMIQKKKNAASILFIICSRTSMNTCFYLKGGKEGKYWPNRLIAIFRFDNFWNSKWLATISKYYLQYNTIQFYL